MELPEGNINPSGTQESFLRTVLSEEEFNLLPEFIVEKIENAIKQSSEEVRRECEERVGELQNSLKKAKEDYERISVEYNHYKSDVRRSRDNYNLIVISSMLRDILRKFNSTGSYNLHSDDSSSDEWSNDHLVISRISYYVSALTNETKEQLDEIKGLEGEIEDLEGENNGLKSKIYSLKKQNRNHTRKLKQKISNLENELKQEILKSKPPGPPKVEKKILKNLYIDIIDPHQESDNGNKYFLWVFDPSTNWCTAVPINYQDKDTIINVLVKDIFTISGIPDVIYTRNLSQFTSHAFSKLMRKLNINLIRNSKILNENKWVTSYLDVIKEAVEIYIEDNAEYWDDYLPFILFALNVCAVKPNPFSPIKEMYGVIPKLFPFKENCTELPCSTEIYTAFEAVSEAFKIQGFLISRP